MIMMDTAVCQLILTDGGPGGKLTLDFMNGSGKVTVGLNTKADVTITTTLANWVALVVGELDGRQAVTDGKLKIKGNMMLAKMLSHILEGASRRA